MTPLQELTAAKLNLPQIIHFTGLLAVELDSSGTIDRDAWTEELEAAKEYQS